MILEHCFRCCSLRWFDHCTQLVRFLPRCDSDCNCSASRPTTASCCKVDTNSDDVIILGQVSAPRRIHIIGMEAQSIKASTGRVIASVLEPSIWVDGARGSRPHSEESGLAVTFFLFWRVANNRFHGGGAYCITLLTEKIVFYFYCTAESFHGSPPKLFF